MAKADIRTLYKDQPDSFRQLWEGEGKDQKRDEYVAVNIRRYSTDEKRDKLRFVPTLKQYESGVTVGTIPGVRVFDTTRNTWVNPVVAVDKKIRFGADKKGTRALTQKEAITLLAFSWDNRIDICLYEEREMSTDARKEANVAKVHSDRADKAEFELAELQEQVKKKGFKVD
jgi:hypothetical protein